MESVRIKEEKNEYENGEVEDKLEITIKQEQLIPDEEPMKTDLIEHFEEEKEEKPIIDKELKPLFDCAYCEEAFKLESDLDVHILTHNDAKFNILKIKKEEDEIKVKDESVEIEIRINENEFFPDEDQIKIKIIEHQPYDNELKNVKVKEEEDKKIIDEEMETLSICLYCEKIFNLKSDLKAHNKCGNKEKMHTGKKPHKCSKCNKSFEYASSLKRHIGTHTEEKIHKCSFCSKSFTVASLLKIHIRRHTGEKPHKCSYCSKSFGFTSDLKRHVRMHTGEKPHKCSYCSKCFSNVSNLKAHIRIHTGEMPHKCPFCSKSFADASNLNTHIRTHTGHKPHKCSFCNKSFGSASDLKRHIRTHTG